MEAKRVIYTQFEKQFVKELVFKYKNVLENKKTNGATIIEKNKAWDEIALEYNAFAGHHKRTSKQLKKCWDNIKTEKKKELAKLKSVVISTGGGPAPKFPEPDPCEAFVGSFATEIEEAIDSDTLALSQVGAGHYMVTNEGMLRPSSSHDLEELVDINNADSNSTKILEKGSLNSSSLQDPGFKINKKRKSRLVDEEGEERIKRVKALIENDNQIHLLVVEELNLKIKQTQLAIKHAAETHAEEMDYNRRKRELELNILEKTCCNFTE